MDATAHTYGRVRHREQRRSQGCRVPPNRCADVVNAEAAQAARRPSPARSRGLRLTRRGRVVVIATVAALLLGGFWLTAGRGALAGSKGGHGETSAAKTARLESVIVGRDDTLWEIAARARPSVDPRITVRRIIDLNSLSDPIVHPGQRLLLPSR
jgi:LysM domain